MSKVKPVEIKLLNKLKTKYILEDVKSGDLIWEGKEKTPVMCTSTKQLERLHKRNLIETINQDSIRVWKPNFKKLNEIGVYS